MARPPIAGSVIGYAFISQSISVVIDPRALGAIADHNIIGGGKLFQSLRNPPFRRHILNQNPIDRRTAAPICGLFNQQNPNSSRRR